MNGRVRYLPSNVAFTSLIIVLRDVTYLLISTGSGVLKEVKMYVKVKRRDKKLVF